MLAVGRGPAVARLAAVLSLFAGLPFAWPSGVDGAEYRPAQPAGWEKLAEWTDGRRFHVAGGGTLLVQAEGGLRRSDDGGRAWAAVVLPPAPDGETVFGDPVIAGDPIDPQVLFAAGREGLYRSDDDGSVWQVSLPTVLTVAAVVVSEADRNLVFAALGREKDEAFQLLRSRDGGATWELLEERPAPNLDWCRWSVPILVPHPTDLARIYRAAGCYGGPVRNGTLEVSLDQGATWSPVFDQPMMFPTRLVVGRGAESERLDLATSGRGMGAIGAWLYRADDGGQSWSMALRLGPVGPDTSRPGRVSTLIVDPANPDRLYAALGGKLADGRAIDGLHTSIDGGATWTDLGGPELGAVRDLSLAGAGDGRALYALTERGLFRLALS